MQLMGSKTEEQPRRVNTDVLHSEISYKHEPAVLDETQGERMAKLRPRLVYKLDTNKYGNFYWGVPKNTTEQ